VETRQLRFSIAQILLLTASVAVFCFVLVNDNDWLLATYVTAALCIAFNAVIIGIFTRGERQIFAIGFVLGLVFTGASTPAASVTLPYLITIELHGWISQMSATPPKQDHFFIVMAVFWAMLAATSSACVSSAWYRRYQTKPPKNDETPEGPLRS
jgi:hypothetical protein